MASADLPFAYAVWIDTKEAPKLAAASNAKVAWRRRPSFSIIVHSGTNRIDVERSISSVREQIYCDWTIFEAGGGAIQPGVDAATGDFVVLLRAGDVLAKAALFHFAEALQPDRDIGILYGDDDRIDKRGWRTQPWFKPQWNEELFLAQDYISDAVALETGLAQRAVQKAENVSELLLIASTETDKRIVHVPHILCHVTDRAEDQSFRLSAVARHLGPTGATCLPGPFGTIRVQWPLPDPLPLVTVIIPTKDKLEVLQPCVESILERTDYANFEILIVDNASVEKRSRKFFDRLDRLPNVRVLSYPHPFNYSAINNFAVGHARGSYICLLNNDTEVVDSCWLTELMRYAVRPEVGAVGAKLLYEDGSIQHAGVVVGIGEAAGHAHRFLGPDRPGYFRMAHVAQFVSAVTGACLVVEKEKFEAVGGLDEAHLAIAFNDVDLCLKLEASGWRNVYVPHAVLVHHESKSRGNDIAPQNIDRYRRELAVLQKRWGTRTYEDPLHNPNLDRYSETFVFRL